MKKPLKPLRSKVLKLCEKQNGLCALCGKPMSLKRGDINMATIDHIIPRSVLHRISYHPKKNHQAACKICNFAKGDNFRG